MTEKQKKEILKSLELSETKFQNMRMKKALDQADGKIQEIIRNIKKLKKWVDCIEPEKPEKKKPKEKKKTKKETICWFCARACGACSWSNGLKPVKGWEAENDKVDMGYGRKEKSYTVLSCPHFINDKKAAAK